MSFTDEDKDWIRTELATLRDSMSASKPHSSRSSTKWSSPLEMRVKSHALAIRALDLELEALTERVTKLEPRH
jgi:hypothetical protein